MTTSAAHKVIRSENDQIKTASNPTGAGRKPLRGMSVAKIAEALGKSKTSIIEAEQHFETAERFPFMQGDNWRGSHVLKARRMLKQVPEIEPSHLAELLTRLGIETLPKETLAFLHDLVTRLHGQPQPTPQCPHCGQPWPGPTKRTINHKGDHHA